jgi:hypothetical protein
MGPAVGGVNELMYYSLQLGPCPVEVFTKTKYMNIHSTIQYIYMNTST